MMKTQPNKVMRQIRQCRGVNLYLYMLTFINKEDLKSITPLEALAR